MAARPAANTIGKSPSRDPVSPSKFKKVALAAHAAMGGNGLSSSLGSSAFNAVKQAGPLLIRATPVTPAILHLLDVFALASLWFGGAHYRGGLGFADPCRNAGHDLRSLPERIRHGSTCARSSRAAWWFYLCSLRRGGGARAQDARAKFDLFSPSSASP
jgi:hypothetical protein